MKTRSFTKVTLLTVFVMSVITAITLNSCQKEAVKPKVTTSKGKSTNNPVASAQLLMAEINGFVFPSSQSKSGKGSNGRNAKGLGQNFSLSDTAGGAIVTIDTIDKPYTITYNYGSGCVGSDGKTRSGVAIITYDNQDIRVVNNVFSLTLQNYAVSGYQATNINGTVTYTNTGTNTNGNLVITETGGYAGFDGSAIDTISINYQYEWIAGANSSPLSNLQFKITGSLYGASAPQSAIDSITSPLIRNCKNSGCNYIIQGTTYSAVNGTQYITTTDYGNPGGCSGQMAVTENGVTSLQNQ